MKEQFVEPEVEVVILEGKDTICTSCTTPPPGGGNAQIGELDG